MRKSTVFLAIAFLAFMSCATKTAVVDIGAIAHPSLSATTPDAAEHALLVTIDLAKTYFSDHPNTPAEANFKEAAKTAYNAITIWRQTGNRAPYAAAAQMVESAYPAVGSAK